MPCGVVYRLNDAELERRVGARAADPSYLRRDSYSSDEEIVAQKKQAPKFKKPPQNLQLVEGSKAYMECTVTPAEDPTMVVEWYKNGTTIELGSRIKPIYEFGFCVLEFASVSPFDSGSYICRASNCRGFAEAACHLSVTATKNLEQNSQLPEEMRAGFEHLNYIDSLYSKYEVPDENEDNYAPVIVQFPEDTEIIEGQSGKFLCRIVGVPQPKLHWYKNNEIVFNTGRIKLWSDGIHHLEIGRARVKDGGMYTVIARNSMGEARHDFTLRVKEKHSFATHLRQTQKSYIETDGKKGFVKGYLDEEPRTQGSQQLNATMSDLGAAVQNTDPSKLKELQQRMKNVLKDNESGEPGDEAAAANEAAAAKYDQGTFQYIPRDPNQANQPSQYVNAPLQAIRPHEASIEGEPQKPVFVRRIKDVTTSIGSEIRFECEVSGNPTPSVRWFKDNGEVRRTTPGFKLLSNGNVHTLLVPKCTKNSFGRIICTIKNRYGQDSISATVMLKKIPMPERNISIPEGPAQDIPQGVVPDPQYLDTMPSDILLRPAASQFSQPSQPQQSYNQPPQQQQPMGGQQPYGQQPSGAQQPGHNKRSGVEFQRKPPIAHQQNQPNQQLPPAAQGPQVIRHFADVNIAAGNMVQFECEFSVPNQSGNVAFYKNGAPIQNSKKVRGETIRPGYYRLTIHRVGAQDAGAYSCVLTGAFGQISTQAYLNIANMQGGQPQNTIPQAPQVFQHLQSLQVKEGQPAMFQCRTNVPDANAMWYFNGNPVAESNYFSISKTPDGSFMMRITETFVEDSGNYRCDIANQYGQASSSAQLSVYP